jgi:TPR repeat protein/cell wall assembly regulator SMI1
MSQALHGSSLLRSLLDRIADWLEANASKLERLPSAASDEQIASLEEALGCELPEELVTLLRFERALDVFEYARILPDHWAAHLEHTASHRGGEPSFAAKRWLPLFEDGGGNLWIVDLSGPRPVVRWWELAGRVVADRGVTIPAFFARLALALESGKLSYDAPSGTFDGPHFDLAEPPVVTTETVIVYRAAELAETDLGVDASDRLPPGAGPYGCLFFITTEAICDRLMEGVDEDDVDHADESMELAGDVAGALDERCDLSAFGEDASVGFHASPAEGAEAWLRSQEDLVVLPLTTLLVALDGDAGGDEDDDESVSPEARGDYEVGKRHFDELVRGDAVMGIIGDVPAFEKQMMDALWRAAEAGSARAYATLGECYFAVLVANGAFDGVNPENEEPRSFSEAAESIEDEEFPPLTYALRCWYEAAVRGDRPALMRFAQIARTGPEPAKRLALELLAGIDEPSPKELYAKGLVHTWLGEHAEAVAAHTEAAEQDDLDAAFELYVMYAQGLGVEADPAASRAWLDRAAEGDHPRALYNVAAEYATGNGREKDAAKAARLYETAAEVGNARAAASLAYMILAGECEGTVDDAREWLDVADDGGFDTTEMLAGAGIADPRAE